MSDIDLLCLLTDSLVLSTNPTLSLLKKVYLNHRDFELAKKLAVNLIHRGYTEAYRYLLDIALFNQDDVGVCENIALRGAQENDNYCIAWCYNNLFDFSQAQGNSNPIDDRYKMAEHYYSLDTECPLSLFMVYVINTDVDALRKSSNANYFRAQFLYSSYLHNAFDANKLLYSSMIF